MIREKFSDDMVNVMLRQLGATSLKTSPAYINIAKFEIAANMKVTYLYEMKEDEIYLQRVSPYPMMIGKLYNEQQIVDFIKADLQKFKEASCSSNFSAYIGGAKSVQSLIMELENLFMSHNVGKEDLQKINENLEQLHELVDQVAQNSPDLK